MPAIARNSVDLPEPDGPVTSTRSPGATTMSSAPTSGVAVGQPHGERIDRDRRPASSPVTTSTTGGVFGDRLLAIEASKPDSRSITARHSASCGRR